MGTDSEVPLAHRLERLHLLDVVLVEELELEPILEQHPADEPSSGDGEAALVGATNDTTNPLGARHGLVAGNLPLDGGGERRKLARLNETEELLARNVGACPVRHRGGGASGGLEAQEAVVPRMRKSLESGMQA
jgi:hypothetical protein